MIDLSVKIEKPPNTAARRGALASLSGIGTRKRLGGNTLAGKELAFGLAIAHGVALKARVARDGHPVDKPRPYADGKRAYYVNPAYPAVKNPRGTTRAGAHVWKHSADFHRAQGTKPGTFNVSGGMWAGLSVVPTGGASAFLLFRGRSQGQAPYYGTSAQQTRRAAKGLGRAARARGQMISNALKAATVMDALGTHALRASDLERTSMAAVVEMVVAGNLAAMSGDDPGWQFSRLGDPKFIRNALDAVAGVTSLAREV